METFIIITPSESVIILTNTEHDPDARYVIHLTQQVYATLRDNGWTAEWGTAARPKGSPFHVGWVKCEKRTPQLWGKMKKVLEEKFSSG